MLRMFLSQILKEMGLLDLDLGLEEEASSLE
jgi:hypothetical protein